jgi:hypothetical protein
MKRIFISALLAVGMVTAIFQVSAGSEAARTLEDYPLVCRGGGSLVIGIAPGERNIGFTFTRGTKPAGEGLAPGECSWKDRGMYPTEPDRVSQHDDEGSESQKEGGKLAPENRWYEELHSADKYWTFMVSNNGRGQLIATSARPNQKMDVSPTARVPSAAGQIIRPDLPRARTPDVETPKVIILNGPADPSSRTLLSEGLTVERNMKVFPAPRELSREEKIDLLKSAGLEAYDETPTPYVTLTPQQPQVAGRGGLAFHNSMLVDPTYAAWRMSDSPDIPMGWLAVALNFETPGIYLMTYTVKTMGYIIKPVKPLTMDDSEVFVLTSYAGPEQTILGKKTSEWQRLNIFVEAGKPGKYYFELHVKSKNEKLWLLHSCDVAIWKK